MLKRLEHKIPPPLWGVLFGLLMWVVASTAPLLTFDFSQRLLLSALIGGAGLSVDLYSLLLFFKAKTTVNPLKPSASALVTGGMYRFSRNPMYLGMLLLLCGWAVYLGALSALLLAPLFIVVLNRLQIMPEERMLAKLFPKDYSGYCSQVRRWL